MESLNPVLTIVVIVEFIVLVVLGIENLSLRAKRRAFQLRTTAEALKEFYENVDAIADDPALPTSALEMLDKMAYLINDKDECAKLTTYVLNETQGKKLAGLPSWQTEMDTLGASRADLAERFQKAVTNFILALFYRWPENAWKLPMMLQIVTDRHKEAALAERITRDINSKRHYEPKSPPPSGGSTAGCHHV